MPPIEFIYFDLGNVILNFDHQIARETIAKMAEITPQQVEAAVFESGLQDRYETGLVNCEQFHREFCERAECVSDQAAFLAAIGNIFSPNRTIFPFIAQLRARSFPIGILSNTCRAHWDRACRDYLILNEFFSPVILSYEINSMKPDPEIYRRAIELAGCPAERCFFMDDRQENVEGALAAGMDAVRYVDVPTLRRDLEQRGVAINF